MTIDPELSGSEESSCIKAHWTIPFVRYIQENDFNCDDGMVMLSPEMLMAQIIENVRAKASR